MKVFISTLICVICVVSARGLADLGSWSMDELGSQRSGHGRVGTQRISQMTHEDLVKQKFLLDILKHINEPLTNEEVEELSNMAQKGLVDDQNLYNEEIDNEMSHVIDLSRNHQLLGKDEEFTLANKEHIRQMIGLYRALVCSRDWDTLQKNIIQARIQVNGVLLTNCLLFAIRDREDTQNLILPGLHEILPELYLDEEIIQRVKNINANQLTDETINTRAIRSQHPGIVDMINNILGRQENNEVSSLDRHELWQPWGDMRMEIMARKTGKALGQASIPGNGDRIVITGCRGTECGQKTGMKLLTEDVGLKAFLQTFVNDLCLNEHEGGKRQQITVGQNRAQSGLKKNWRTVGAAGIQKRDEQDPEDHLENHVLDTEDVDVDNDNENDNENDNMDEVQESSERTERDTVHTKERLGNVGSNKNVGTGLWKGQLMNKYVGTGLWNRMRNVEEMNRQDWTQGNCDNNGHCKIDDENDSSWTNTRQSKAQLTRVGLNKNVGIRNHLGEVEEEDRQEPTQRNCDINGRCKNAEGSMRQSQGQLTRVGLNRNVGSLIQHGNRNSLQRGEDTEDMDINQNSRQDRTQRNCGINGRCIIDEEKDWSQINARQSGARPTRFGLKWNEETTNQHGIRNNLGRGEGWGIDADDKDSRQLGTSHRNMHTFGNNDDNDPWQRNGPQMSTKPNQDRLTRLGLHRNDETLLRSDNTIGMHQRSPLRNIGSTVNSDTELPIRTAGNPRLLYVNRRKKVVNSKDKRDQNTDEVSTEASNQVNMRTSFTDAINGGERATLWGREGAEKRFGWINNLPLGMPMDWNRQMAMHRQRGENVDVDNLHGAQQVHSGTAGKHGQLWTNTNSKENWMSSTQSNGPRRDPIHTGMTREARGMGNIGVHEEQQMGAQRDMDMARHNLLNDIHGTKIGLDDVNSAKNKNRGIKNNERRPRMSWYDEDEFDDDQDDINELGMIDATNHRSQRSLSTMTGRQQSLGIEQIRAGELLLHNLQQLVARINLEEISLGRGNAVEEQNGISTGSRHQELTQQINEVEERLQEVIEQELKQKVSDATKLRKSNARHEDEIDGIIGDVIAGMDDRGERDVSILNVLREIMQQTATENAQERGRSQKLAKVSMNIQDAQTLQVLRRIVQIADAERQQQLRAYRSEELQVPGISINAVSVDHLRTFVETKNVDLTNVIADAQQALKTTSVTWTRDQQQQQQRMIVARQQRLNHKDFNINLDVTAERNQRVVVRTLLGPKVGETSTASSAAQLNAQRQNFILLDAQLVDLLSGRNQLKLKSRDIKWTARDTTPFSIIYKRVMQALNGATVGPMSEQVQGQTCRFPHRLLLPRGRVDGLPMQLLVVITALEDEDRLVQQLTLNQRVCGLGIGSANLDRLPLGFPLDRPVENAEQLISLPNVHLMDVQIYHDEQVKHNDRLNDLYN